MTAVCIWLICIGSVYMYQDAETAGMCYSYHSNISMWLQDLSQAMKKCSWLSWLQIPTQQTAGLKLAVYAGALRIGVHTKVAK